MTSKEEAVTILGVNTPYSIFQWIHTFEEIERLGLQICEVKA